MYRKYFWLIIFLIFSFGNVAAQVLNIYILPNLDSPAYHIEGNTLYENYRSDRYALLYIENNIIYGGSIEAEALFNIVGNIIYEGLDHNFPTFRISDNVCYSAWEEKYGPNFKFFSIDTNYFYNEATRPRSRWASLDRTPNREEVLLIFIMFSFLANSHPLSY